MSRNVNMLDEEPEFTDALSFGKWRGVPLHQVDKDYLQWVYDNVEVKSHFPQSMRDKVERILGYEEAQVLDEPQSPFSPDIEDPFDED